MTFCLGMKVQDGLVGIADTRVTSGSECITARKISLHELGGGSFFLMTSGLRSVRDKALTYFQEALDGCETPPDRLYKAVNMFARDLRRVADEDKKGLESGHFRFDLHALFGGQLAGDRDHKLYLLYPQGNWIDIGPGTPYSIIGETGYGKPILDRTLKYHDPMPFALKVGCLAFDSTRISAANVDFPIDVVVYERDTRTVIEHRYEKQELQEISAWWQSRLRTAVTELPSAWTQAVFGRAADAGDAETILLPKAENS